jgi:hypothetical protein
MLAAARSPLSDEQFLDAMERRGVTRDTAEYLRSWLMYAYRGKLRPAPDDRIFSGLHVLGDDVTALTMEFFERHGTVTPKDLDGSAIPDPSLVELGRWLDSKLITPRV